MPALWPASARAPTACGCASSVESRRCRTRGSGHGICNRIRHRQRHRDRLPPPLPCRSDNGPLPQCPPFGGTKHWIVFANMKSSASPVGEESFTIFSCGIWTHDSLSQAYQSVLRVRAAWSSRHQLHRSSRATSGPISDTDAGDCPAFVGSRTKLCSGRPANHLVGSCARQGNRNARGQSGRTQSE